MKPDWEGAPEWAKWLAMDEDENWGWYEFKPSPGGDHWVCLGKFEDIGNGEDTKPEWGNTLEPRPWRG